MMSYMFLKIREASLLKSCWQVLILIFKVFNKIGECNDFLW